MKLKFYAGLRNITKCKEIDITAPPDIWSLLLYLGERYGDALRVKLFTPDGEDITSEVNILLNGRNIHFLQGKNTQLTEADTVSIFPLVAGG